MAVRLHAGIAVRLACGLLFGFVGIARGSGFLTMGRERCFLKGWPGRVLLRRWPGVRGPGTPRRGRFGGGGEFRLFREARGRFSRFGMREGREVTAFLPWVVNVVWLGRGGGGFGGGGESRLFREGRWAVFAVWDEGREGGSGFLAMGRERCFLKGGRGGFCCGGIKG